MKKEKLNQKFKEEKKIEYKSMNDRKRNIERFKFKY